MLKEDNKVLIKETRDVGYVVKVLERGGRVMVRIPSSDGWPFPHHVVVDSEKVTKLGVGKSSVEEALF